MRQTRRAALLGALLAAGLPACQKRELPIIDGEPVQLAKRFEVPAGRHYWSFWSKPGEEFTLDVWWPGALKVEAGSASRKGRDMDNDDDDDVERAQVSEVAPHHWHASWRTGPKGNLGSFAITLAGGGVAPIEIELDKKPR